VPTEGILTLTVCLILAMKCNDTVFLSQGPLSVTEELHSLNFEAMLMLQGLDIDLEVCFSLCVCMMRK